MLSIRWSTLFLLQCMILPFTVGNPLKENRGSYNPFFEKKIIKNNLPDGYWVETFRPDKTDVLELLAFGLGSGEITLYQNLSVDQEPTNGTIIQNLDSPVALDTADINNDGFNDVIVCFQYGRTMLDNDPDGGRIVWLENPGQSNRNQRWKMHYIGKSTAMHRLKIGHFTQTQHWEVIGLPIVSKPYDLFSPVVVSLFEQPENLLDSKGWPSKEINNKDFSIIHDAVIIKNNQLDSLLIASNEGINWFYFDEIFDRWQLKHIGDGAKEQKQHTGFHGSGGVDVGRVKDDNFAYIAAIEPFHGNTIAVYVKSSGTSLNESQWTRYILDVDGYPNQNGESSAHYIVCADFDKDGDDEFLVAQRGPAPNQGVTFYKPIDISHGLFAKWKIDDESASRIAVADFDHDGVLDLAVTSYTVAGYYEASIRSIRILYNRFIQTNSEAKREIEITREDDSILFKVPRPKNALKFEKLPFLNVNDITMSLVVVPPNSSCSVPKNTYVKVMFGNITWDDSAKGTKPVVKHFRTPFINPRTIDTIQVESDNELVSTDNDGALLMLFQLQPGATSVEYVQDMKKLLIENALPDYVLGNARELNFTFIRYDNIDSHPQFQNLEFYNMKGFRINFIDTNESLCELKFWSAGLGVNAGVHNHRTDTFCEVHVTLINGSGKGGMHFLNSSQQVYNSTTTPDTAFQQLPLPTFYEHGPLWDLDAQNKPVLRSDGTVVYPWHKWQAGTSPTMNQSYDIWLVLEFNSKFSELPYTVTTTATTTTTTITTTTTTTSSKSKLIPSVFNLLFIICFLSRL